jgi:hypothetical protein
MMRNIRSLAIAFALLAAAGCRDEKKSGVPEAKSPQTSSSVKDSKKKAHATTLKPKSKRKTATKPKLPALKDHEKPKDGPAKSGTSTYVCGSVWVGDHEEELDCIDPTEPELEHPARAVLPRALLDSPPEHLPQTVDHREDGFEGPTRGQGHTLSCTAHAFAEAIDHDIGLWTGKPGFVSVMQIWARYHTPSSAACHTKNMGQTIAAESDWPFDEKLAHDWTTKGVCKSPNECGKPVDEDKLKALEDRAIVLVDEIEKIDATAEGGYDLMQAKIAGGRDLVIGITPPKPFVPVGEAGSKYIPDHEKLSNGGHMVTLVGYDVRDDGRYFLLKNSWGTKWGDNGYAWIHEKTLQRTLKAAFAVDIDPVGSVGLVRLRRKKGHVPACGAGEVPDAITMVCGAPCDDGSPPSDDSCADGADCDAGFVNVHGECVLAAPQKKGVDPVTKISFACGPGGCTYDIPRGAFGCQADQCQKSCPAPDFRLGEGAKGLICLE